MKRALIMGVMLLSGCETLSQYEVKPLVEMEHVSHALQHIDKDVTNWNCSPNCGYNLYSIGARWRPGPGVTVDLLEGYTKNQLHGQKEVFTGRITWEIGAR